MSATRVWFLSLCLSLAVPGAAWAQDAGRPDAGAPDAASSAEADARGWSRLEPLFLAALLAALGGLAVLFTVLLRRLARALPSSRATRTWKPKSLTGRAAGATRCSIPSKSRTTSP